MAHESVRSDEGISGNVGGKEGLVWSKVREIWPSRTKTRPARGFGGVLWEREKREERVFKVNVDGGVQAKIVSAQFS